VLKLITAVVLSILATAFAAGNMHRVHISPCFGDDVEIRAIFLILSSFLAGCLVTALFTLYLGTLKKGVGRPRPRDDDDGDEFFS